MQLKKPRIVSSLAVATCSLLNVNPAPSIAQEAPRKWDLDAALLYYGEQERVQDLSTKLLFRRAFDRDRTLSATFGYDTLTGASANGALPAGAPQTFTAPSGSARYTTPARRTPLDPTFKDSRVALSADWAQPLGTRSRLGTGLSYSSEFDYLHTGANAEISRDFNERNTTLSMGMAFARDTVSPVGGVPDPFVRMRPARTEDEDGGEDGGEDEDEGEDGGGGSGDKTVTDLLFGITQAFGPRTIGQLSYSISRSTGYLTDPYKVLSVIDPVTGDPAPGPGRLNLFLYESRPDSRTKQGLFGLIKRHLGRDVVDLSYRYMFDDWGVRSHTADLHYRWQFGNSYLQPHLRYYTQSAADFHMSALLGGDPLPDHASADYRLGELDATTIGVKYAVPRESGREWGIRIEYYNQSGKSPPGGAAEDFGLDPSVDALIVQLGYSF